MQQDSAQKKTAIFYIKRITGLILLLAMAAIFLFSGITKLFAFDPFVWNIMDAGVSSMKLASVMAGLFIGLEFLLGMFLIFHVFLRSVTYPVVITLLVLFSIYLVVLIVRRGDDGNCGCFGEAYMMKPSEAIIKNLLMIAATVLLYYIYPSKVYRHSRWIALIIALATLITPFVLYPPINNSRPQVIQQNIDLTALYHSKNPENKPAPIELRQGKHIVAFMSLTCSHCRKAAFLLQVIHRQHPEFPIFFVLNGDASLLPDFFQETQSEAVPHMLFRGAGEFLTMAGTGVPAIYFMNNGIAERKANYFQLDPVYIDEWLKQ